MTLPASGSISMNQVSVELGVGAGSRMDFNDSRVRTLAGRPSGAISMADLRGKSAYTPMTLDLYSSETGSADPMGWSASANPSVTYSYNCGITAGLSGGVGPFTYVFSKNVSLGNLTYSAQSPYANWAVTVPRFSEPGSGPGATFTCTVTDSTGRQVTKTKDGYLEYI